MNSETVFDATHQVLLCRDPTEKCSLLWALQSDWRAGRLTVTGIDIPVMNVHAVGRPDKPELLRPRAVPRRSLGTPQGRLALLHALTHIEFNAINLAVDAAHRFHGMPKDYYTDWIGVAADEARHFTLLNDYLTTHDCRYGDYPAHDGLWDMAVKTAHDVLARMALVPRVLEARGLDVTPAMIEAFAKADDARAAEIMTVIYNDEIGHVAVGSRWFEYLCQQRGLEKRQTFRDLVQKHFQGRLRGPFNNEARLLAGFDAEELERLEGLGAGTHSR
jgi:uncharacterized ferritin-like protein (DUF455 family)